MADYARALTEGVVGNEQLVGTLAETIADRIVVKMTTSPTLQRLAHCNEERAVAGI